VGNEPTDTLERVTAEFTETTVGLGGHRTPSGGWWHNLGYAFYNPRYRSWWAL